MPSNAAEQRKVTPISRTVSAHVRLPTRTVPPALLTEEQRTADPGFTEVRPNTPNHARMLKSLESTYDDAKEIVQGLNIERHVADSMAKHAAFCAEQLRYHCALLADTYVKAHPWNRPFWYCQGKAPEGGACTYATDSEEKMANHIATRHAGQKVSKTRLALSTFDGGAANNEVSCALTVAVAMWQTRPEARRDTPAYNAFRSQTVEATENLIASLPIRLPTTALRALHAIVSSEVDTESRDDNTEQSLVTIGGEVNTGCGAEPTAKQLANMAREKENHAPIQTATEVLFNILPPRWSDRTQGVRDIPLTIGLRSDNHAGPTTFVLHAVGCAVSRRHLVAYVRELCREDACTTETWHRYDGAEHTSGAAPPSPNEVVLLLYRRADPLPQTPPTPPNTEAGEIETQGQEVEEVEAEDDDRYSFQSDVSVSAEDEREDQRDRDELGCFIFAGRSPPMSLLGGSPSESSLDEERCAHRLPEEDTAPPAVGSEGENRLFHSPLATPREQRIPVQVPEGTATTTKRHRATPSERTTDSSTDGGEATTRPKQRHELEDTLHAMLAKIAGQNVGGKWSNGPGAALEDVVYKKETWTNIFTRSTRIIETCAACGFVPPTNRTIVRMMLLNAMGADCDKTAEAAIREALDAADPPDTTTQCPECGAHRQRILDHTTPQAVAFFVTDRRGVSTETPMANIPRIINAPHATSSTVSLGLAAVISTCTAQRPTVYRTKWDAKKRTLSWIRIGERQRHIPVAKNEVAGNILVYLPAATAHQDAATTADTETDSWDADSLWREIAPRKGQHGLAARLFAPAGCTTEGGTTAARPPPTTALEERPWNCVKEQPEPRATPDKRESMRAFLQHLCAGASTVSGRDAVESTLHGAIAEHETWEALFSCGVETERRCQKCGQQDDTDILEDTAVIGIQLPNGVAHATAQEAMGRALGTHTAFSQLQCAACGAKSVITNRRLLRDAAFIVIKDANSNTTTTTAADIPRSVCVTGRGGLPQPMLLAAAACFESAGDAQTRGTGTRVYLAPPRDTEPWDVVGGDGSQGGRKHAADIVAQAFLYTTVAAAPAANATQEHWQTEEEEEEQWWQHQQTQDDRLEETTPQQENEEETAPPSPPPPPPPPHTTTHDRPTREEIIVEDVTATSDNDDLTIDVDTTTVGTETPVVATSTPLHDTTAEQMSEEVFVPATPPPAHSHNDSSKENEEPASDPFLAQTPRSADMTRTEEAADTTGRTHDEQQQFAHGTNMAAAQGGESILCPFCVHQRKWEPKEHGQHKERTLFVQHLNNKHRQAQPDIDLLKAYKIDRCLVCGMFVVATERARAAHRCRRQATTAAPQNSTTEPPEAQSTINAVRDFRGDTASTEDEEWMSTTPSASRWLHKKEWEQWRCTVGRVLTGYTASAAPERWRRQLEMTTVVRNNLGKQRRKNGNTANAPPADTTPRTDQQGGAPQQRTRAARREVTEEDWGAPQAEVTTNNGTAGAKTAAEQQQPPHEDDEADNEDEEDRTAEEEAQQQQKKRILNQLALGALAKAARTLFNTQLPRATVEQSLPQLHDLHPQEDVQQLPLPNETPFVHDVKPERVKAVIVKKLGRAAAPGLDGWTRELLIPITEDNGLLAELTTLVQDILVGNVSSSFATRIRACVLSPFRKEMATLKVRPITPESVLAKLASHIALDSVDKSFRATFKGWQYGVWGDSTEAVKEIRAAYKDDGADTLVALDATNAYNRMSRKHILEAAYAQPALRLAFGAINLTLGAAGTLALYENGARVCELRSTRGVRQGMVLSPLLFANGMASVLAPIMRKHPHVRVVAYLDDITVVGKNAAVQNFLEEAGDELSKIGFDINPAKSHHLSKQSAPPALNIAGTTIPLSRKVVRILGAGFRGDGLPVEEWVWEKTREYDHYFEKLGSEWLPRLSRLQLLRGATVPRMNHLLRTHRPEELNRATTWFDEEVLRTAKSIANVSGHTGPTQCEEQQRESSITELLVRLPLSKGGLGLRSQNAIAQFAAEAVGVKDGQRAQTAVVDATNQTILFSLLTEPDRLLVEANTAAGATRALVDPAVVMPDYAAEIMLKQRLLQRVLPRGCTCVCGKDADNHHVNTCSRIDQGARIERHNMVRDAIVVWAREIGFEARAEPPNRYETTDGIANSRGVSTTIRNSQHKRLDVEIATPTGNMTTDVTITYPGRTETGALPVQEAFANKKRKHGEIQEALHKNFVPLAMESTGGIHRDGFKWLREVAGTRQHPYTTNTALSMVLTRIAQNVHIGNAHIFHVVDKAFLELQRARSTGNVVG